MKLTEDDEIELRAMAATAVNSPLPQASTQAACIAFAEYMCKPLEERIAELEETNRTLVGLMSDIGLVHDNAKALDDPTALNIE